MIVCRAGRACRRSISRCTPGRSARRRKTSRPYRSWRRRWRGRARRTAATSFASTPIRRARPGRAAAGGTWRCPKCRSASRCARRARCTKRTSRHKGKNHETLQGQDRHQSDFVDERRPAFVGRRDAAGDGAERGRANRLSRFRTGEQIPQGAGGPHLRLLAENGASVMVYGEVADAIQGKPQPLYKRPRFSSAGQWQAYADKMTAFARHTLSHGVRLSYHHHMGAYVESPDDVDRLMALTGPELGLLFDSGHMTFGGGDAVAVLRKHIARVSHVHCKDVRPAVTKMPRNANWSFLQSVMNGAFSVPGDGCIDFDGVLRLLYQHGYEGWLVVEAEQDPAVAPSYQYAQMGFQHLTQLVRSIEQGGVAA